MQHCLTVGEVRPDKVVSVIAAVVLVPSQASSCSSKEFVLFQLLIVLNSRQCFANLARLACQYWLYGLLAAPMVEGMLEVLSLADTVTSIDFPVSFLFCLWWL